MAVCSGNSRRNGNATGRDHAYGMLDGNSEQIVSITEFFTDARQFGLEHPRVGLVLKPLDLLAACRVPDCAVEADHTARRRFGQLLGSPVAD